MSTQYTGERTDSRELTNSQAPVVCLLRLLSQWCCVYCPSGAVSTAPVLPTLCKPGSICDAAYIMCACATWSCLCIACVVGQVQVSDMNKAIYEIFASHSWSRECHVSCEAAMKVCCLCYM